MSKLNWISDADLNEMVSHLLSKAKIARETAENKFGKNVIDPFSALFETAGFNLKIGRRVKPLDKRRKRFKTMLAIFIRKYSVA